MVAMLCRRGAAACCIHRELFRVVWRPQNLFFSTKPTDRKPPRRTHIKKAKPPPPVDVNNLVERLFSLTRSDIAAPKARLSRGLQKPPSPPPPVAPPPASSVASSSVSWTASSPPESGTSPDGQTSSRKLDAKTDVASQSSGLPASLVESLPESTVESPIEPRPPPQTGASVVEGPVESSVEVSFSESPESQVVQSSHSETSVESPAESSVPLVEPRPGPVEFNIDVTIDNTPQEQADIAVKSSHPAGAKYPIKTTIDFPVESEAPQVETLMSRGTTDATIDQEILAEGPGFADYATGIEHSIEVTIQSGREMNMSPMESLETTATTEDTIVQTVSIPTAIEQLPTEREEADGTIESTIMTETASAEKELEKLTLESVTLHAITVSVESFQNDELFRTKSELDHKAALIQATEYQGTPEGPAQSKTKTETIEEGEVLTEVLSRWESLSEDLKGLEGESGLLVHELLCPVLTAVPQKMYASDPPEVTQGNSYTAMVSSEVPESEKEPEKLTLESMTLHTVTVSFETFQNDELFRTKSELDHKAALVQTTEHQGTAETKNKTETVEQGEVLTEVLLKWESLSKDVEGLKGESDLLVHGLLCSVPIAVPQKTDVSAREDSGTPVASGEGHKEVESPEKEVLQESCEYLLKESEDLVQEKVEVLEDTTEAEVEPSVMMEAMFGSEHGLKQLTKPQEDRMCQDVAAEPDRVPGQVLEAMSVKSATLSEVEFSLGTQENMSEMAEYLENKAQVLVGKNKKTDLEDKVATEETLSLPEAEDLETEVQMGELLCIIPGHPAVETDDVIGQDGVTTEIQTDVDPVQRLFLQKIREYNQISRLSDQLIRDDLDLHTRVAEETAKLQRAFGGGDLTNFPQLTFPEPDLDQDSR